MLIKGSWALCEDGVVRPVIRAFVLAADSSWLGVDFLVDSGADRTTFIQPVLLDLNLQAMGSRDHLTGLGGITPSIQVHTNIRFHAADGSTQRFVSQFPALTDPKALDMSVLGRDILETMVLILDRDRDRVWMLMHNHPYHVEGHGG